MDFEVIVLKVAGLITAISVIWKFGVPLYKRVKKRMEGQSRLEHMIKIGFDEMNSRLGGLEKTALQNKRNIIKIELLSTIRNEPRRAETIEKLFAEYRDLGGNSYVCEIVEAWREIHEKKVIKERISDGTK